jgi:biopolymer transport protein ExbD
MINLQDDNDSAATDVNMTPMIDCVFLLLIFFLVASTLRKPDELVRLNLPEAASAQAQPTPREAVVIAIDQAGQTFLDGRPTDLPAVVARVRAAPDQPVRIRADERVAYQHVMRVIDQLQLNGITQVGLTTTPGKP